MQLDNDLLGIWLKAETLTKEEIRFLIETIQTQRNQLEDDGRDAPIAVEARLRELATMPRDRPPLAERPTIFALGDYFTG
jgi:hypothetical protein